jgi:hypothetical protein
MSRPWNWDCGICESVESIYPCPINNCSKHFSDEPISWVHSNCGGRFRLYENGKEKCQICGKEDLFCRWNYSCSSESKNQKISSYKLRTVLQYLVGLDDQNVSEDFWFNIKASFKHQKNDYPSKFL